MSDSAFPFPSHSLPSSCSVAVIRPDLGFATTAELQAVRRAGLAAARHRGDGLRARCPNGPVTTSSRSGPRFRRHAMIEQMLKGRAATEAVPGDTCHVHNFARSPTSRSGLGCPVVWGCSLRDAMTQLVEDLHSAIRTCLRERRVPRPPAGDRAGRR